MEGDVGDSGNGAAPESEISIRSLTKTFGGQTVWEDVTFDLPKGKISEFYGKTQSAKSTTAIACAARRNGLEGG